MLKAYKKLWVVLGVSIVLCPLGLLATGTAFGEWGTDQLPEEVGFVPAGLAKFADFWQGTLMPDYGLPGWDSTFLHSASGYILSALVGTALIVVLVSLLGRTVKD